MDEKQYSWSFERDSENYSFPCDSIDECLEEAREENEGEYEKVFIGVVEEWDSHIDIDTLIENIQDDVYRDSENTIEDYLDNVKEAHKKELGEELNKIFDNWKNKYNYKLHGFFTTDIKAYNL